MRRCCRVWQLFAQLTLSLLAWFAIPALGVGAVMALGAAAAALGGLVAPHLLLPPSLASGAGSK